MKRVSHFERRRGIGSAKACGVGVAAVWGREAMYEFGILIFS